MASLRATRRAGPQPQGVVATREFVPHGRGLAGEDWRRRHRGMLAILWLHVVGVPAYGLAEGYGVAHSLAEGALLTVPAVAASVPRLSRALRAGAVAVGLLTASALLVHFSGGYIEFHFHFFVMIVLLALYQHWLPFSLAVAYVLVHHGLAGTLDPDAVYNHPDAVAHPWKWASIHGGFVLAASAASVFTWRVAEREQIRRRDIEHVTEATLARLPLARLVEEVLARVAGIVGADGAALFLLEGDKLVLRAAHGAPLATGDAVGSRVAATGERTVKADGSRATVPLLVEGMAIGVLDVAARPGRLSDEQVRLLQVVADRVAPSIDRARLYEREHRIAETLQRSLLPKRLPIVPGVGIAVRYLPAGEGLAAGGDWYDVVQLPRDRLGIAVGDVVGHGIDAASMMGQLRTGLRAYAAEDPGPEGIAVRLGSLLTDLDEREIATLLYVELNTGTGEFSYVCAGHPPPLLQVPCRVADYLGEGRTTPLGMGGPQRVAHGRAVLPSGGTLILYTDGLVERRGQGIDTGLESLRQLVSHSKVADVETLADAVLEGLQMPHSNNDDIALVVVRREPVPAEPASVPFRGQPVSLG